MKAVVFVLFLLSVMFSSCRKDYVCECKNANGTYVAGEKEGTRSQAKKYCKSLSSGSTTCNIK